MQFNANFPNKPVQQFSRAENARNKKGVETTGENSLKPNEPDSHGLISSEIDQQKEKDTQATQGDQSAQSSQSTQDALTDKYSQFSLKTKALNKKNAEVPPPPLKIIETAVNLESDPEKQVFHATEPYASHNTSIPSGVVEQNNKDVQATQGSQNIQDLQATQDIQNSSNSSASVSGEQAQTDTKIANEVRSDQLTSKPEKIQPYVQSSSNSSNSNSSASVGHHTDTRIGNRTKSDQFTSKQKKTESIEQKSRSDSQDTGKNSRTTAKDVKASALNSKEDSEFSALLQRMEKLNVDTSDLSDPSQQSEPTQGLSRQQRQAIYEQQHRQLVEAQLANNTKMQENALAMIKADNKLKNPDKLTKVERTELHAQKEKLVQEQKQILQIQLLLMQQMAEIQQKLDNFDGRDGQGKKRRH